jgi:ligand-binding sensor domain-containing protein
MHDERNGLGDDWVRCVARASETLYVGTYVGGLFEKQGAAWKHVPNVEGAEVTDLRAETTGSLLVATRAGVYRLPPDGTVSRLDKRITEAQALCPCADGLWIGTRMGAWLLAK